jgi:hypothetical protein
MPEMVPMKSVIASSKTINIRISASAKLKLPKIRIQMTGPKDRKLIAPSIRTGIKPS